MSKEGYMESEGMKRGSATKARMRSEIASVTPIVSKSSFVSAPRKERTSPPGCDASPGALFASGLIAAGGIMGLMGVINAYLQMQFSMPNYIRLPHGFLYHDFTSVLAFGALAFALFYFARKPLKK